MQTKNIYLLLNIYVFFGVLLFSSTNSFSAEKKRVVQNSAIKKADRKISSTEGPKKREIFAGLFTSVGYTFASLPPVTSVGSSVAVTPSAPTLLQWEIGLSAAYRLPLDMLELGDFDFYLGATASYRYIGQYSAYDSTVGNYRGTRLLPIAPLLVIQAFSKIVAKFEFQFLGSYVLSNSTAEGQQMSYSSPFGGKVTLLYPVIRLYSGRPIYAGIFAEYLSYKTKTISNVSDTQLSQSLVLMQGGLTLGWIF